MRRMLLVALGLVCACDSTSPPSEEPPHTLCGNGVVNLPDEVCDDGERNSDTDLHACRTDCSGRCKCSRYFECAVAGDSYTCSGECPEGFEEYTDTTANAEGYERGCDLVGLAIQLVPDGGGEPVDATPYKSSVPLLAELDAVSERIAVIPFVPPTVEVAIDGAAVASGEASPWIDVDWGSNIVALELTDTVEMYTQPLRVDAVVQNGIDLTYVKASNTDAEDRFGEAVAVDGDTMVVGATGEASAATGIDGDQEDDSAPKRGAVYVFRHDGAAWSQEAYIKAAAGEQYFGGGVALSGDDLAVRGSSGVSMFRRAGTTWSAQGTLPSTTCASWLHLVGDTLAFLCDEEVRVYRADGDQWTLEATLTGADAPGGFDLVDDIALGGETIVANGYREDENFDPVIITLVFRRSGTTWELEESLCVDPRECAGETELSPDGTWMAVRAGFEDDRNLERIHVLARGPGGWVEETVVVKYMLDADFGSTLAIGGDRLAIRSLIRAGWVTDVYQRDAGGGLHHRALIAHPTLMNGGNGGNLFWHLDLSNDFLIMGAAKESSGATGIDGDFLDTSAPEAGAAFVVRLSPL